jgi:hypothetical protein
MESVKSFELNIYIFSDLLQILVDCTAVLVSRCANLQNPEKRRPQIDASEHLDL